MITSKYFIKVLHEDFIKFEKYLIDHNIEYTFMSSDWGTYVQNSMTHLYSVVMDRQEAVSLSLTFPLAGCMNFVSTMDKLRQH